MEAAFARSALLRHPCAPDTDTGDLFHKHQCPHCGDTWAHLDALPALQLPKAQFDEAHTCAKCGTAQYLKLEVEETFEQYFNRVFGGAR